MSYGKPYDLNNNVYGQFTKDGNQRFIKKTLGTNTGLVIPYDEAIKIINKNADINEPSPDPFGNKDPWMNIKRPKREDGIGKIININTGKEVKGDTPSTHYDGKDKVINKVGMNLKSIADIDEWLETHPVVPIKDEDIDNIIIPRKPTKGYDVPKNDEKAIQKYDYKKNIFLATKEDVKKREAAREKREAAKEKREAAKEKREERKKAAEKKRQERAEQKELKRIEREEKRADQERIRLKKRLDIERRKKEREKARDERKKEIEKRKKARAKEKAEKTLERNLKARQRAREIAERKKKRDDDRETKRLARMDKQIEREHAAERKRVKRAEMITRRKNALKKNIQDANKKKEIKKAQRLKKELAAKERELKKIHKLQDEIEKTERLIARQVKPQKTTKRRIKDDDRMDVVLPKKNRGEILDIIGNVYVISRDDLPPETPSFRYVKVTARTGKIISYKDVKRITHTTRAVAKPPITDKDIGKTIILPTRYHPKYKAKTLKKVSKNYKVAAKQAKRKTSTTTKRKKSTSTMGKRAIGGGVYKISIPKYGTFRYAVKKANGALKFISYRAAKNRTSHATMPPKIKRGIRRRKRKSIYKRKVKMPKRKYKRRKKTRK